MRCRHVDRRISARRIFEAVDAFPAGELGTIVPRVG
jgi:hypothetical protein